MSEPAQNVTRVASALGRALDADDFEAARALLAPDCTYTIGGESLVGPDAILGSYAAASEWARTTFEHVTYESEVEFLGGGRASILYTDILEHKGLTHEHRSRQVVTVGTNGLVLRIVHQDQPGERKRLREFFARCGVTR